MYPLIGSVQFLDILPLDMYGKGDRTELCSQNQSVALSRVRRVKKRSDRENNVVFGKHLQRTFWFSFQRYHQIKNPCRSILTPFLAIQRCHFWVIWAHLLAQNTQSIYYLGKLSFEALWRSCLLTTEPPNSLVLFSEIMIWKKKAAQNHFAIFGLYELKFWLRPPSPYNMWPN